MQKLPVQHRALEISDLKPCEPYFGEPIGARPQQGIAVLHSDPSRGIVAGIWECAPGRLKLAIKSDEFCHIIAGHWILRGVDGTVTEVVPGDSFFFPRGWTGECEIRSTVRKVFTIIKTLA